MSGSSQAPFPVTGAAWELHKVAGLPAAVPGDMWG